MTGLAFFQSAYLWALAFLAVPILIHFFNRKQTVSLRFSSIRFFRASAIKANRARNLRRLLQLLTRLLIVALLVMIFAKPYDPRNPFTILKNPETPVYCWIDPTVSMSYRQDGHALRQKGVHLLDSLQTRLPGTGRLRCYDPDRGEYVPFEQWRETVEVRYGKGAARRALRSFEHLPAERTRNAVLVLLSDFQAPTTAAVDSFLQSDSALAPVACVSVAPPQPWNYSLRATGISRERTSVVLTTVAARGKELENGGVYAVMGGMRTGHSVVSLAAGDSSQVTMQIADGLSEAYGLVKLDAEDPFEADNADYFVRTKGSSSGVLIVGNIRENFPLAAALGASSGGRWAPIELKDPTEVRHEDLEAARLVVLSGVETPTRSLQVLLRSRALGRKAVVFAPALKDEAMSFNREVFAQLGIAKPVRVDTGAARMPVLSDTLSAVWQGFPRLRDRDVAVYRSLSALPGQTLARLDNAKPLAARLVADNGHCWIVLSTPLGISAANNLCETGFYVPFVDRLARHAYAGVAAERESWIAGEPKRNPYFGARRSANVYTVDNVLLGRWENQPMVVIERPGVYRVQPAGEADYWITVRMDPREADLTYREPTPPEGRENRVKTLGDEEFPAFVEQSGSSALWYGLWAVLAALLVVEMLLWPWNQWAKNTKGKPA